MWSVSAGCFWYDVPALTSARQMIANAGILRQVPLVDLTVEDWDEHLAVNARGVMLCFKHAARQMIQQGRGGRIIGDPHETLIARRQVADQLESYRCWIDRI